jgi:hypothetical protein
MVIGSLCRSMVIEFDALWHSCQALLDFVDRHGAKVPAVDADSE